MKYPVTLEIIDESIAYVTLNRPEARNALSTHLLDAMQGIIKDINNMKSIRCVVITGTGEKAFCAGADLKERSGMNTSEVALAVERIGQTIQAVETIKVPVIASLNGGAFGGGLELALACDLRISEDTAVMGLTETSLGIIPGAGGTQRLPRLIGPGKAKELIYTARKVSANEALDIGLVEKVVPEEQLREATLEWAQQIAKNAPVSLQQAKKAINLGYELDIQSGLKVEALCYQTTIQTKDRLEGLQAFKEKRDPVYTGD
ncbi:3-hydroxybutyryl-CoA dehydratase [Pontibacillus halophilus JSM 076056 = DSM 19796]|uniref:3-hydroxybutyryl-CoA dehydratase n=1 Tax=Pontibacillus halophilus JSM 076056 = DSM 19796 TaxID=1385510 RepID=A0A0A5GLL8_9BACI|nr:enoyl-CoA hydratase [Pontibacillus halophilus]KGX92025.1 3-hydroxybutyryl-CoA dehydratase [Pontibacillus halophilus JSM 076056 = DSM 19796]